MNCREFREQHCAFVDDMLSGMESVAMHHHMAQCGLCAVHDAKVRRALMVVRSLPQVEISAGFDSRLRERLATIRPCSRTPQLGSTGHFGVAAFSASVLLLAYIATTLYHTDVPRDIVMEPLVTVASDPSADTGATAAASALLASASAGLPLWSAIILAEQAPAHFAAASSIRFTAFPR
jgi:hypothetical protein